MVASRSIRGPSAILGASGKTTILRGLRCPFVEFRDEVAQEYAALRPGAVSKAKEKNRKCDQC
jgi:hypothetical protein